MRYATICAGQIAALYSENVLKKSSAVNGMPDQFLVDPS